jgi:hypothetical protein
MIDLYLKIGAVVLGSLILLSNFVNFQSLISKLVFRTKTKPVENTTPVSSKQEDFLEIVSLWYQLKHKCDENNLHVASEKLDEVFPLLNGVLDETNIKA